jgi:peptide deformylase
VLKIKYFPDEPLTSPCDPVGVFDKDLHDFLDQMAETMEHYKGMGLAANQVGELKQVFIMKTVKGTIHEFINPQLSEFSEELANLKEGCLSAPGIFEIIHDRSNSVTVTAQDRNGKEFTAVVYGIEAVCVQHEYAHLKGEFYFSKFPSRQVRRRAEKQWKKARRL